LSLTARQSLFQYTVTFSMSMSPNTCSLGNGGPLHLTVYLVYLQLHGLLIKLI